MAMGPVADPDAGVAAGSFAVSVDGRTTTIELDGTLSLRDLAAQLNAAKGGFTASVVQVGDGEHRLILEGAATGSANTLTVDTDLQLGDGATTIQAARDAVLRMGSGADAITLTRASNTITDLVPGATITLTRTTTEPVTVTAQRDADGAAKAVKSYVDALNGAIGLLEDLSRYDATSGTAGKLQGDPTARRLLGELRATVTGFTSSGATGALTSGYQVGIGVDRTGKVTLDEDRLRAALADDFDAVGRLLSGTRVADDPLATSVAGTSRTAAGTHQVEITREARIASVTGAAYTPPTEDQPKTFRITQGTRTATVTLNTEHATVELAAQAIRDALAEAGMTGLTAEVDGGALRLDTTRYGSVATFAVEGLDADGEVDPADDALGLAGTFAGQDVEGTIGGIAATGAGRTLTSATGIASEGLSVTWTGTADDVAAGASFAATFGRGMIGEMGATLRSMEGSNGSIARARQGVDSQIAVYQTRIEGFEQRLLTRESTLRRQFTAMETALARLNSQGEWLTSQLGQLQNLNQANRR